MASMRCLIGLIATCGLCTAPALGTDELPPNGTKTAITLSTGETFTGTLVSTTTDSVTLAHPVLGEVTIPRAEVGGMDIIASAPAAPQPEAEAPAAGDAPAAAEEEPPKKLSFTEGWELTAAAGLNGSTGNTERYNIRASLDGERLTERMETRTGLLYTLGNDDGTTTENRFEFNIRNDWLMEDSPWRYFAQGRAEYDEFQDWDMRLTGFGGVGYEFWKDERSELVGRAGIGGSQLLGGTNEGFTLEALLGLDYKLEVNDDQRFKTGIELYPSLEDAGEFRARGYAEYEVDLNDTLKLTAGIEDRYDTDPGEAKRNDLDYYLLLVYSF